MTREELRRAAKERIRYLEANFAGEHVDPEIQSYFRLMCLIANGLEIYYRDFGWQPLDESECFDAKYGQWRKELSPFERDAIQFLNADIERKESTDAAKRVHRPAASVQPAL
jgi:hypothetical protein